MFTQTNVKMIPRLSLRRFFLYLTLGGLCTLLLLLYQNRDHLPPVQPMQEDQPSDMQGSKEQIQNQPHEEKLQTVSQPLHNLHPPHSAVQFGNHSSGSPPFVNLADERNIASLPKLWFFKDGTVYPEITMKARPLFPDEDSGDRISHQLMNIPHGYEDDAPEKIILAFNGLGQWYKKAGSDAFHGCPVSRCALSDDKSRAAEADAIIFKDHFTHPGVSPRPHAQIWMIYFLECPYHTQSIRQADVFNWTATYRRDSTLVAPYEKWMYYDETVRQRDQFVNHAANKTKLVAWFVSNCGSRNRRLDYARELSKYIQVDIYGTCGTLHCPRSDKKCFELLEREYKFYLAFENSNCQDYITEKLFVNGLGHSILPVVMGARPEDYERAAPQGSYIHVDEFSGPKELAQYLRRLDENDELYNTYFKWKGTGEFINTYFWCRLCSMMHSVRGAVQSRSYTDINEWWRGVGVCALASWRNTDLT